jgi:hypothetical protein
MNPRQSLWSDVSVRNPITLMSQGVIQAIRRPGASKSEWVLGLFVGLSILTMIRFVPYIGGLVRLGVVCVGLGAFAAQLYRASRPVMSA